MLAVSPEPMPSFTDEDHQVYMQISQQTSLILQNISLLNQTRRRLDEVNLLLDFSRQLSGMDTDAIIKSLLDNSRRVSNMLMRVCPDLESKKKHLLREPHQVMPIIKAC